MIGSPAARPDLFVWSTAHGHYHLKDFNQSLPLTDVGAITARQDEALRGHSNAPDSLTRGSSAHAFRHTFASILIVALKLDPARVASQLGHANPAITLKVYTHLFEQARHADELRTALSDGFGHLLRGDTTSA